MEPSSGQRAELARRITSKRIQEYGSRKAAYIAADVNPATWAKAEDGERLAERSLIAIVKLLWPETGGDWRLIDPPLGEVDLEEEIRNAPFREESKEYMLRLVREDRAREAGRESS